jgi:hypothetical protein
MTPDHERCIAIEIELRDRIKKLRIALLKISQDHYTTTDEGIRTEHPCMIWNAVASEALKDDGI